MAHSNPPAGDPLATPAARARPARTIRKWAWGTVLVAVLLVVLYTAAMLAFSFSEGERAGVLQKLSRRGWVCKTWEGELAQYVVGGVAPQIWHFSVRDRDTAERLQRVVGQQVRLHYEEHVGLPTNCFGETAYFVTGYELLGSPPAPPAGVGAAPAAPAS